MGLVQEVSGAAAAATGFTTDAVSTNQENVLALIVGRSGGAGTGALTGVTDQAGNTWTLATRGAVSGVANTRCEVWVTTQDVAGLSGQTVSATSGSSQASTWKIVELDELNSAALLEAVSPDNSGAVAATSHSTPTVTTDDPSWILSVINHPYNAASDTFDSVGGVQLTSVVSGTAFRTSAGYYEALSDGSYDGDWTLPASAAAGLITIAFRKADEPPPTPPTPPAAIVASGPVELLRWHVCDSLTGNIVGRLAVNGYDITEEVRASTVGNLTVAMPDTPPKVTTLRNLLKPGDRRSHGRAIAMEDLATGRILFHGPIAGRVRRDGAVITIPVTDWSAWFRSAVVRPTGAKFVTKRDYVVTNREQCTIMLELLKIALGTDTAGNPAGRPNIVVDDPIDSGVNRDRTARMFSKVGEHLDEISNMDKGAEWFTYGTRNLRGTQIVAHAAVAWPERGTGQIPIRLSWRQDLEGQRSGNLESFSWPTGEDLEPTRVFATDAAEEVALWGYDQDNKTIGVSDIVWETTIDLADGTTDKATATARAKGELTRAAAFDGLLEVVVAAERLPFTALVVGDRARVEIDDGWNRTVSAPAARIVRRVMAGGAGKPTTQTLTVDLDDNRFPYAGGLPGVAAT